MTDTLKFQEVVKENGLKYSFLAKELNISEQTLINKRNNVTEFNASEIDKLVKIGFPFEVFFAKKSE